MFIKAVFFFFFETQATVVLGNIHLHSLTHEHTFPSSEAQTRHGSWGY